MLFQVEISSNSKVMPLMSLCMCSQKQQEKWATHKKGLNRESKNKPSLINFQLHKHSFFCAYLRRVCVVDDYNKKNAS